MVQSSGMEDYLVQNTEFWRWFLEREDKFYNYEKFHDSLLEESLNRLKDINGDLVFEIGPEIDGKREFIISANGLKEGFSAVIELAKAAPELDRWVIVPFRQRKKDLDLQIQIEDRVLSPEDIFFTYQAAGKKVDINLYIAGINPEDERVYHLVLLLLDNVIGEYDVEMKLEGIEIHPLSEVKDPTKLYSLKELPGIIDQHFSKKVD